MRDPSPFTNFSGTSTQSSRSSTTPASITFCWAHAVTEAWFCMIWEPSPQSRKSPYQTRACVWHSILYSQLTLRLVMTTQTVTVLTWEEWTRLRPFIKIILERWLTLTFRQQVGNLPQDLLIGLWGYSSMMRAGHVRSITLKECRLSAQCHILWMATMCCQVLRTWTSGYGRT